MKFRFFKRKPKPNKESTNDVETTAFVLNNMKKARNMEHNVDPVSIFKDSYHNLKDSK